MMASSMGRFEVMQALLDGGANVNAKTNKGATALMVAAERGSDRIIQALLDKEPRLMLRRTMALLR